MICNVRRSGTNASAKLLYQPPDCIAEMELKACSWQRSASLCACVCVRVRELSTMNRNAGKGQRKSKLGIPCLWSVVWSCYFQSAADHTAGYGIEAVLCWALHETAHSVTLPLCRRGMHIRQKRKSWWVLSRWGPELCNRDATL